MGYKSLTTFVVVLVLFVSVIPLNQEVWASEGNWKRIADMRVKRGHGPAGAVLPNGNFIVIGGASEQKTESILDSVEMYDAQRDRWIRRTPMGRKRTEIEAVQLDDGRIFVPGGRIRFGAQTPRVTRTAEIYDPVEDKWTNVASMKTPRRNYRMVKLQDGSVLVAGGRNDETQRIRSMEIYDPKTNRWTSAGNMRTTRFSFVMETLPNGKVLFAGGTDDDGKYHDSAEIYDPVTKKWTNAANMIEGRSATKTVKLRDGRILVMGGRGPGGINTETVEVYRTEDDSWTKIADLTSVRRLPAAAILSDGHVIVAGGRNSQDVEIKSAEIGYFNHAPIVKLLSPDNNHIVNANDDKITLKWSASDIEGDRITDFRLKIGTSQGTSDVLDISGRWDTSYTFDFSDRTPQQTYYWTVMARDELGDWSDWAPTRSFTVRNRPPVAQFEFGPTKTDRLHDVFFINNSSDLDGDELSYEWEYRLQGTPSWTQFSTDAEPKHKFPSIGKYDLRLTATDPYGASDSYTRNDLEIYNLAPTVEATSPVPDHVIEMGQTEVKLEWEAHDPEGDPMNQYELKIGTTDGGNDVLDTSGSWRTSYTFDFSERNPNQTYYWSVRGRDIYGDWSSWTPVRSFKVPKQLDVSVEHAPRWEDERIKAGRSENEFLAGEPFLIVAKTSNQAVEVIAEAPFDVGSKTIDLIKERGKWNGTFYDRRYANLDPGSYTFTVIAKYGNGYEESEDVTITIKGGLGIRVHRTY